MTRTREATLSDVPNIVAIGRRFHAISPWSDQPFCGERTANTIISLMDAPNGVVFYNGHGILGGVVSQALFGSGIYAQELFWFADKGGRDLIQAFEEWAKTQGAKGVIMLNLTLDPRTDKLMDRMYKRKGYAMRERSYYKDL